MSNRKDHFLTLCNLWCEQQLSVDQVTELHMWAFKDHLNILLGKHYIKAFLQWFINTDGLLLILVFLLWIDTFMQLLLLCEQHKIGVHFIGQ